MKKLFIAIIWFACFCSVQAANTDLTDGNSLLKLCDIALKPQTDVDLLQGMYLQGYLKGFLGGMSASKGLYLGAPPSNIPDNPVTKRLYSNETPFNIPNNVTTDQEIRVIKKWLENNPKRSNENVCLLIYLSLKDAFPPKEP